MRTIIGLLSCAVMLFLPSLACGQNGYVKLQNDSIIYGFLRFQRSIENGQQQIELWESKADASPTTFNVLELNEYAFRKDTFRVLRNFFPFWDEDLYFEIALAELITSGTVDLLQITDHATITATTSAYGALIPALMAQGITARGNIYILQDGSGRRVRALKKDEDEFARSIRPFIENNQQLLERVERKELGYKDIENIVLTYNAAP